MKITESLIAFGICAALGIAADRIGYTQAMQQTEQFGEIEEIDSEIWITESPDIETEETETEFETDTEEKCIYITDIHLKEEDRYYDGTTNAEVEAMATGVPEGVNVVLHGEAENSDAGRWPVKIQAELEGENSENYRIQIEDPDVWMTIKPRPLQIKISNARKCYYSENEISSLIFEKENPIEISGFLECDQEENGLPRGFEWPELVIDEKILQKDSPMYEKGREIRYQDAVTLKRDTYGNLTGNPTRNYIFNIEETEFFDGGDVILSAPPISGTLDYTVQCSDPEAFKMDETGTLWIRDGESLIITPTGNGNFTDGKVISGIHGDGTEEFSLIRRNQAGEIIAESQIRSISWKVDREAPKGSWILDGTQMKEGVPGYVNCDTQITYAYIQDAGSGIKSIELYPAYDEEITYSGETLYKEKRKAWVCTGKLLLGRQGTCRVWARAEDQVGNVQYYSSEEIVMDRTAPEIWFENIQAGSANKRDVEPVCKWKDENLQTDTLKITVSGYRNGKCQAEWEKTESQDHTQVEMKMKNLPFSREWDDIYTLQAEAKDLAGNCCSREIVFSVNRFGSVYYLGEDTKKLTDQFYVERAADLKVYEVNVDYLTESGILLGHEGETRQLQKDRDYTVKKTGDDKSWKEYCYTISSGCFEEEGLYYLICASEDRALNVSDNRMRKQKLEFAVDKTEPDILLTGVEVNGVYREKEKIISLECRDNLALKEITVWINGKKRYRNAKEEQQIELQSDDNWQRIRVTATDKAGNSRDTGEIFFWLNEKEARPRQNATGIDDPSKATEVYPVQRNIQSNQEEKGTAKRSAETQKQPLEKNWKILASIAVITGIWAIFLKTKKEK